MLGLFHKLKRRWYSKPSVIYPIKRLTADKRDDNFYRHSKSSWKNPNDNFHKKQATLEQKENFSIWYKIIYKKEII